MALNKYNLPMSGLRKACSATVNWSPRSGGYTEIFYDRSTGEIWTVDQVSLGHNSWTQYDDPNVIKICETSNHMTMQEIADRIHEVVTAREKEEEVINHDR